MTHQDSDLASVELVSVESASQGIVSTDAIIEVTVWEKFPFSVDDVFGQEGTDEGVFEEFDWSGAWLHFLEDFLERFFYLVGSPDVKRGPFKFGWYGFLLHLVFVIRYFGIAGVH